MEKAFSWRKKFACIGDGGFILSVALLCVQPGFSECYGVNSAINFKQSCCQHKKLICVPCVVLDLCRRNLGMLGGAGGKWEHLRWFCARVAQSKRHLCFP